jgi:hypothetical protein
MQIRSAARRPVGPSGPTPAPLHTHCSPEESPDPAVSTGPLFFTMAILGWGHLVSPEARSLLCLKDQLGGSL